MNWQKKDKYHQTCGDYSIFAFGRGIDENGKTNWHFAANFQNVVLNTFQTSDQARQACQQHKHRSAAPAEGG